MTYVALYCIFTYLFITASCLVEDTLKPYLTLNQSLIWLHNETKAHTADNKYCQICCMKVSAKAVGKRCGVHTMCKYPTEKYGPACKGFIPIHFTEEEITAIVDAHNTIRNHVAMGRERAGKPGPQPKASNMRALEWNEELAFLAARWAAQCIFRRDLCRDVERYPVGQNIERGNFATDNDIFYISQWYNSVDAFDSGLVPKFQMSEPNNPEFQYSQLVWAETYQIGCARVVFQHVIGSAATYREHFICNYGPSGNIPGQPVYRIGNPCSECPDGTDCTVEYPGLCAADDVKELHVVMRLKTPEPRKLVGADGGSRRVFSSLRILLLIFALLLIYA